MYLVLGTYLPTYGPTFLGMQERLVFAFPHTKQTWTTSTRITTTPHCLTPSSHHVFSALLGLTLHYMLCRAVPYLALVYTLSHTRLADH